jgi:hypothetical protein
VVGLMLNKLIIFGDRPPLLEGGGYLALVRCERPIGTGKTAFSDLRTKDDRIRDSLAGFGPEAALTRCDEGSIRPPCRRDGCRRAC